MVGLARAGQRHPGDHMHPHGVLGDPAPAGAPGASPGRVPAGREEDVDGAVGRDHACLVAVRAQLGLEGVEIETQAEYLGIAVGATDDLEHLVDLTCQVAGPQLLDVAATAQVGRALGIAEHHVGPGVDELAHSGTLVDGLVDRQSSAGDGDTDRAGVPVGQVGWQPRHPGGGLGLAVHHDEVPATLTTHRRPTAYVLRREAATGLGDVPEVGQLTLLEATGGEQVEGVRDTGEAGRAGTGEEVPEALVHDAQPGQHDTAPGDEVGVEDGQAVAVVQRQRGDRAVTATEPEVVGDRCRVAGDVVA